MNEACVGWVGREGDRVGQEGVLVFWWRGVLFPRRCCDPHPLLSAHMIETEIVAGSETVVHCAGR